MKDLKQKAREEFKEKMGYAGSSGTFQGIRDDEILKFIDFLIDRTIQACIAAVPEGYKKVPKSADEKRINYEAGYDACRTLTLERLSTLHHYENKNG